MNNSYLFFKKVKPNKTSKQVIANSNKSIAAKLNHSVSGSSNHSNHNKSQPKTKKQSNFVLTKR
jgi:DNA-binding CsgD family transcriptional regulator